MNPFDRGVQLGLNSCVSQGNLDSLRKLGRRVDLHRKGFQGFVARREETEKKETRRTS